MDEALAYTYNLRIEASTKQLILDMIKGIRSVVRTEPEMTLNKAGDSVQAENLQTYVTEVIRLAEDKPEILSGIFNIDELKRYLRYSEDYLEISNQLQELLQTVKKYRDVSNLFTIKLANLVREHLDMVDPDGQENDASLTMAVIYQNQEIKCARKDTDLRVVE